MNYGGIDDAQAAKVGNIVRYEGDRKLLIDGRSGKVLIDIPADPTLAKQEAIEKSGKIETRGKYRNVAYGDCGYSYMYLQDAPGGGNFRFWTGFELYSNAHDFGWEVTLNASGFNYQWSDYGPMDSGPSWTSGWVTDDTPSVGYWHYIEVDPGSSAFLDNGGRCYTYGPADTAYIY